MDASWESGQLNRTAFLTFCCILIGAAWVYRLYPFRSASRDGTRSIQPSLQRRERGINLVQTNTEKTESNTNIDIIAIHGLDTTSSETWLWKDQHDPKNQDLWVNWLKESNMLPREVGPARIFTCDWPADLLETSDIVQATNQVHARVFLDGLRRHLSHANHTAQTGRPLLFIASCLGGIILMQALVEADNVKSDYRRLREATRGIIFLATPFRGTSFADIAPWAEPCLKALANTQGQRVNRLLDNVKSPSTYLNDLVKKFTLLCQDKAFPCHVFTFYEAKTTILPWKQWPRLLSTQKALVNESSATLDFVPDPLPLNRNHKLMNKFENERCGDYRVVASKICHFLENIRNAKSPLQQADEWLETRIYDDEKLRIERLSGSYLPMKDCYINLAIVESPKGANQDGGTEQEGRPQYNQFSQEARLKVNRPGKDSEVDLATLFSPRRQANGTIVHPRRILIHGRAGIGKTTLCKKIVFEFRERNWPEWSKLFDRILWIPLRNLKLPDRQVAGYNFKLLCYHEFFSEQSREDLAQALSDDSAKSRTLFLLDGLDEVSQDLSGHDSISNFLRTKLLRQPNVIITSRPYPRLPEGIDLELETIGFHPDQATRYLRASLDEGEADKIKSFLRDHPLMRSLMRIPIQLDALCFLWGGEKSLRAVDTMTEVYRAIEEGLWKKDIIRLGKKRGHELVAPGHLESATWRELELHIKEESIFLERLAFSGMEHEIAEFDKQRLDDALVDSELSIDKTVPNLSFLRCSDTSRSLQRRTYHFIHLTYQEYFAAKYFVRMYAGMPRPNTVGNVNSQPALDLLQSYKYAARYDIVWRFAAGLLGSKHVASFFEAIETKPIDLVGTVHQRLVMHCLSEANMRDCSSTRRQLEDRLSQWLLFASHFEKSTNGMLSNEPEFPDQSLFDALEMGSHSQKIRILKSIDHPSRRLSKHAVEYLEKLSRTADSEIQNHAIHAFRTYELSDDTINNLLLVLKKPGWEGWREHLMAFPWDDHGFRDPISEAIRNQNKLPAEAIEVLMEAMHGNNRHARRRAAVALGCRSDLKENITDLVRLLERPISSEDYFTPYYRNDTLHGDIKAALESTVGFPSESVKILERLLKSTDPSTRHHALQILGMNPKISQEAVKDIVELFKISRPHVLYEGHLGIVTAKHILKQQKKLPIEAVKSLVQLVQASQNKNSYSAAEVLACQLGIPLELRSVLQKLYESSNVMERYHASVALNDKLNLTETTLADMIYLLEDENLYFQDVAYEVLSQQSSLSNENTKRLIRVMGKHPVDSRMSIILSNQSRILAEATAELLELIEPLQGSLQYYIADVLRKPSTELSESAISRLRELSKHPEEKVRMVAVTALSSRSNLLSDEIQFLQTLLRSRDSSSRIYAARALEKQRNLPDEVITDLLSLIQERTGTVVSTAVDALKKRSDLPKDATQALASLLFDPEWDFGKPVIHILENQSEISRDVANVFISKLKPVDHVGCRVSRNIAKGTTLLGKILEGLGLPLRPQESASASTLNLSLEDIEPLYGCFLYRSFEEHFCMQVNDDKTLTIHQPSGTRIAALEIDSTDIFLNWRKNWEAAAMNCDTPPYISHP